MTLVLNRNRNRGRIYSAEFVAADCTKTHLRPLYRNPDQEFDIVSCQFAFHYCFESLQQAECMLKNVSECLKFGGFFIGTTPDSYDLVTRIQDSGGDTAGNSVYSVKYKVPSDAGERIPLFGAKYDFHLEGVVDCPEFLVHFPTLEKLAKKYDLVLVAKRRFGNYFKQFLDKDHGRDLLSRMNALETYPAPEGKGLVGRDKADENYASAKAFLDTQQVGSVGTLSKDEWEAATLYVIFAFKKMKLS